MVDEPDDIGQIELAFGVTVNIPARFTEEESLAQIDAINEFHYISQISIAFAVKIGVTCLTVGIKATTVDRVTGGRFTI